MMTNQPLPNRPIHRATAANPMLLGAGFALALITMFLISAGAPDPGWPRLWILRPVVIVPMAGGLGGLFYHTMDGLRSKGGWRWWLANAISLVVYFIVLWLGAVLGLDGTWWD